MLENLYQKIVEENKIFNSSKGSKRENSQSRLNILKQKFEQELRLQQNAIQ